MATVLSKHHTIIALQIKFKFNRPEFYQPYFFLAYKELHKPPCQVTCLDNLALMHQIKTMRTRHLTPFK